MSAAVGTNASSHYVDDEGKKVDMAAETWAVTDTFFGLPPAGHHTPASAKVNLARLSDAQVGPYNQCIDTIEHIILSTKETRLDRVYQLTSYGGTSKESPSVQLSLKFDNVRFDDTPTIHEINGRMERLTPALARSQATTYEAAIYTDVRYELSLKNEQGQWEKRPEHVLKNLQLGKIPIMLGSRLDHSPGRIPGLEHESGECRYDIGGYFIINGQEKVLIPREMMIQNHPMVFEINEGVSNQRYTDECWVRSTLDDGLFQSDNSTKIFLINRTDDPVKLLRVRFGNIKSDIPLFILFRALNVAVDRDIFELCTQNLDDDEMMNMLHGSLEEASVAPTTESARIYLARKLQTSGGISSRRARNAELSPEEQELRAINVVMNSITRTLFPHMGENYLHKAAYLGFCVHKLLSCALKRRNYDDRDHMGYKKIETSGVLLANLFYQVFRNKILGDLKRMLPKELSQPLATRSIQEADVDQILQRLVKPTSLDYIRVAFQTSKWGFQKRNQSAIKVGVSQQMPRINHKATVSSVRKLVTPLDTKAVTGPHKLHFSQYGFICPSETPDGEQIGITKHLALMSTFTVHTDPRFVRRLLPELGVANLEFVVTARKFVRSAKVFVNGRWEGCHEKPVELVDELRRLRRSGLVHPHTCIYWNIRHQEIQIWTTGGRMVRPLYIVDPDTNRLRIQGRHYEQLRMGKMSWDDLLGGRYQPTPECPDLEESPTDIALIEYIDPLETENCMIAMTVDDLQASHSDMRLEYTHCEIHPSLMLSAVIGDVPFPNHSHAPRVIYWGNMGRQSIGIHATNYKQRMDTMAPLLYYPQLPLISTRTSRYTFTRELPTGQMCIVAIASYSGYNQEDSVILNGDSVDRGLFIRAMRKTYKDVEKHTNTEGQGEERIEFPPPNTINMRSDYSAIDQKTGLPLEGSFVRPGSVILSKVVRTTGSDMIQYKDTSMMLKNGEAGKIDRVELTTTAEGYKQALIGVRQERIPEIGDKFASRMAQKGTIGIILPREDMPFTADGIVPDIIINPHCMPSRMTISQLIEMLFSKVCAIKGIEGDGSPFQGLQIDDVARLLGTPVSEGGCGFQDITSPDGGSFGDGHEVMYSGLTGTQFPARVFMGPCYYVSLKHMVQDKAHSRSTGAVQPLTRQPAEGRSRDGGLRLGEMERDCMISHGAASFQREKFMDCSDFFSVWIDRKTGFIAKGDPTKDTITLRDGQQDLRAVYIPYSFKVLVQELMAMGIGMRFRVD